MATEFKDIEARLWKVADTRFYEAQTRLLSQYPGETFTRDDFQAEGVLYLVLTTRLRPALTNLNPTLLSTAIDQAVAELAKDRSANHPVHANHDLWHLLLSRRELTEHQLRLE